MGRAVEHLPGEDGKPSVCGRSVHRLGHELLSHVQIRHLTENTRASGEQRTHSDWLMTGSQLTLVS